MTSDSHREAIRALEAQFVELFTQVRRLVATNAERVSPGLNSGSYKVFTTIVGRGPVTLSALADCLQIDKGQLSRTVRDLEQRGLVHRTGDPDDRRSSLLSATDEGHARLTAAREAPDSAMYEGLRTWDERDIRELTRLVGALVESSISRA